MSMASFSRPFLTAAAGRRPARPSLASGKFDGARTDFVNGEIDDVRFYDSPLSAGDAAYIGNAGSSIVNIATGTTGATVSPDLFGAFMEDINYGGDGGIYNDEVRNSGFNDSTNALNAWAAVAGSGVNAALTSDTTTGPTSAPDAVREIDYHIGGFRLGPRWDFQLWIFRRGGCAFHFVQRAVLRQGESGFHRAADRGPGIDHRNGLCHRDDFVDHEFVGRVHRDADHGGGHPDHVHQSVRHLDKQHVRERRDHLVRCDVPVSAILRRCELTICASISCRCWQR